MWVDIKERLRSAVLPVVVEECGKGYNPSIGEGLATSQEALEQVVSHVSCITIGNRLRIVGGVQFACLNEKVRKLWPGKKIAVAQDAYGGLFALSCGDFPGDMERLWYYAPDTLAWEMLEMDYSAFHAWVCTEGPRRFYGAFSWADEGEILSRLAIDQGVLFYPFPWTAQYDAASASKKVIPLDELIELYADIQHQLDGNN